MRLALVRHGQTPWNLTGRLQGSSDTPLNPTGTADAARSARTLASGRWEAVVSSPLSRARETADIVAQHLGIRRMGCYPLLTERSFGAAEGLTLPEAALQWPHAGIRDIDSDATGLQFPAAGGPGVEPIEAVRTRGLAALEHIAVDLGPTSTIVVCHGTLIRVVLSALAGFTVSRVPNGAHYEIRHSNGRWIVDQ